MQFKDVVGNESTKQHLRQLVQDGRVPHATLYTGRAGTGGLPLALAMAQYMMCKDRTAEDSCGICATCAKIENLVHPDIILSFPVINEENDKNNKRPSLCSAYLVDFREFILKHPYANGSDWIQSLLGESENKQGNITAKEVADINTKLSFFSVEGGIKILLMWLPEFLGNEGNKLLKQIEEPPEDTLFFFVSDDADKIIATIKSRTQLVQLQHLQDTEINQALIDRGIESKIATQVTRLAEGNFNKALSILEGEVDDNFQNLRLWLNALLTNDGVGIAIWVEQIAKLSREGQKQFLLYFLHLIEHVIRIQYLGQGNLLLEAEELNMIKKLISMKLHPSKLDVIANLLQDAMYKIERNLNGKIIFHALSLHVKDAFAGKVEM